jgi:hypothetical protein
MFFSSENGSERNSEGFLFRETDRNGIPRFFFSAKQAEFRRNCRLFHLFVYAAEFFFLRKIITLLVSCTETQDPEQPAFFGAHFHPHVAQGYMSGGAGYVLSR